MAFSAITDATAYADPYTVGGTKVLTLTPVGAVGTVTWTIGAVDFPAGSIVGADTGTGSPFSPTIQFNAAGTVRWLVQATDSGTPGVTKYQLITRTVLPAAVAVRNGAGNITDADAQHVTNADTSGGSFTLTFAVTAAGRKYAWWTFRNTGANVLTLAAAAGDTIDGAATITVAAGKWKTIFSDDRNALYSIGN